MLNVKEETTSTCAYSPRTQCWATSHECTLKSLLFGDFYSITSRWRLFGDRLTSEFFQAVREVPQTSSITELIDEQGIPRHSADNLDHICSNFYSRLYSQAPLTAEIQADRESILSCVSNRFTPEMVRLLEQPLTKDELHSALVKMAKGRSPDPDGVTLEFFLRFWDLIGDEYTKMLQSSFTQGCLPQGMTSGVIALIFKDGDRANLSNWRPITLLNVSYKILAKRSKFACKVYCKMLSVPISLPFYLFVIS